MREEIEKELKGLEEQWDELSKVQKMLGFREYSHTAYFEIDKVKKKISERVRQLKRGEQ